MREGEELAIVVDFSGNGEPVIRQHMRPRNEVFTNAEVKEAYISASSSKDMRADKAATSLFQEFRKGGRPKPTNGKTYEVFTWSNADKETVKPPRSTKYKGQADCWKWDSITSHLSCDQLCAQTMLCRGSI